jgi:TolA-binding protein
MTDPKRLIDEGATDFERLLVASAANERPSVELGARMEAGVISSKTAVGSASWTLPWTWVGALAVVASGLAALLAYLPRTERSALPAEALQIMDTQHTSAVPVASPDDERNARPAPVAAAEEPVAPSEPVVSPKPSRSSLIAHPQQHTDVRPLAPRSPVPQAAAATPVAEGDLHEEMLLIDGARAALRERDNALALRELRQHAARFPRGTFVPEALALRVEVLERDGQHAKAVNLGRQFLAAYPDSPLATRVERITADEQAQ